MLRSPVPLGPHAARVSDWLLTHATRAPDRLFLAEPSAAGMREVRYGEALASVRALGAAMLARGLAAHRPLLLLSGNDVDHALLTLAAMHVGVPAAPLSPAYSAPSSDFEKLALLAKVVGPGAIFATDGEAHAPAISAIAHALGPAMPPIVVTRGAEALGAVGASVERLEDWSRAVDERAVERAHAATGPDSVAKILFTSGSTGTPKGVVNTQRMLTANQQMIRQCWPFLDERPPITVDWLPWSHTFGGNHNFFMMLANGGTMYVDAGKPVPGAIEATVSLLRRIAPTLYFNVPRGFAALLPFLEAEPSLAETFFSRLDLLFYAAAALPDALWERYEALSKRVRGEPVCFVSAWGSTETSPLVTSVHFPIERAGVIGLPAPGTELALVPVEDKLELRVAGPNVSPGAWSAGGAITPASLDAFGHLPMGDAGKLEDPADPSRGVVFDGRIAENFKLSSGTWVHVGELRLLLVGALAPLAADVVIAGHDRDAIAILVVPSSDVSRLGDAAAEAELARLLAEHNLRHPHGSRRIAAAAFTRAPLSIDRGELTDKGYVNQRAVLTARATEVAALFGDATE